MVVVGLSEVGELWGGKEGGREGGRDSEDTR